MSCETRLDKKLLLFEFSSHKCCSDNHIIHIVTLQSPAHHHVSDKPEELSVGWLFGSRVKAHALEQVFSLILVD